jgi:uncharacterized protein (TIGR03118 family)
LSPFGEYFLPQVLLPRDNPLSGGLYHCFRAWHAAQSVRRLLRAPANELKPKSRGRSGWKIYRSEKMSRLLSRVALGLTLCLLGSAGSVYAQVNSYAQTNLVSDTAGMAKITDPKLSNPWGISLFPGGTFWIADNNSGVSTLYDAQGNIQQLVVTIPPPNGVAAVSTPSGTVANATQGFQVTSGGFTGASQFLFDTEDGTISGWNGNGTNAALAVDNSMGGAGAVYKGLAIITNSNGTFLLAANFRAPALEVYDANFKLTQLAGNFTDPTLPSGFAPFGVHVIGSQVIVTYAMQNAAKHDPVNAPGNGFVSLFDLNGNFQRRVASNGNLNSPWGAVMAPAGFGAFGGDLLVGNFGDGTINAFDLATGNLIGQMKDGNGQAIVNLSLWDMVFGVGGTGDPNTLYFTAGLTDEQHGLFGTLTANAPPPAVGDFSIAASPATAKISAGQSATISVTLGSLNGFGSATTLSCSGLPTLATCSFSPSSVTPQAGAPATSTLTISTKPAGYMAQVIPGMDSILWGAMSAFGLLGLGLAQKGRKRGTIRGGVVRNFAMASALCLVLVAVLTIGGCGGYGSSSNPTTGTPAGTTTIMVTATSGALTHSTAVTLTVQ